MNRRGGDVGKKREWKGFLTVYRDGIELLPKKVGRWGSGGKHDQSLQCGGDREGIVGKGWSDNCKGKRKEGVCYLTVAK